MLEDIAFTLQVFRTKQGAWHKLIQLMRGFHFPSTRTTNSVRLILGSQYSLCENYIKRARLLWGLKSSLTKLIPALRTKFDTQTKRVPAWPVLSINFDFRNVILQLMLFPFVWAKYKWNFMRDRCKLSFSLPPAALPLARSRETRFTRSNRRTCS